jgi:hypothetical protein
VVHLFSEAVKFRDEDSKFGRRVQVVQNVDHRVVDQFADFRIRLKENGILGAQEECG